MTSGTINVNTENIFPIIKKFLYSDHEIFLRELVSNAVDATQKLRTLSSLGEFKGEIGKTDIEVKLDRAAGTITVSDRGIGMTREEVEKYINQIAFSGAEEFVQKYKDKGANAVIGHFGLGFYSAFMVASKVELITRSMLAEKSEEAVRWECDGSPAYEISEAKREERGTDVILHIAEDSKDFLEEARLKTILEKYCRFLPVPIYFEGKQINNTTPAWTKSPSELSQEDYQNFYRELYPFAEDPLFHIHLNVDYPFNLTGILYFPKLKQNVEIQKNKIQLYSNQVFVTDSVEGIVPDFLTLLHGVLDSPDIPLNVSRSYLQSDGNVKKISAHITKKVADKLEEIFKNTPEVFKEKWDDIKLFIEYGILTDDKFSERAEKFQLLKNTTGDTFLLKDYLDVVKPAQTNKDGKTVILYTGDPSGHHLFIDNAGKKGYDVLVMDSPFTSHLVGKLEQKNENVQFARVDSDIMEKLIDKGELPEGKLSAEEIEKLKPVLEQNLQKDRFTVRFENMSETGQPVVVTQSEWMRRMKEMSLLGGNTGGAFPEGYDFVVNSNHPVIQRILNEKDSEKQGAIAREVTDLALLSQNLLRGEALTSFINRNIEHLKSN